MKWGRPSLGGELAVSFAVLFASAVLVVVFSLVLVLSRVSDPRAAFALVLLLVVADFGIVVLFMRHLLRSRLTGPIESLRDGTGRIAEGDYGHRLRPAETQELEALRTSINALADELLADQQLLAQNVASLERTNEELVAARDEVLRSARLASVGTLAAGIAHEVGNPLGALLGFADLARMQAEREGRDPELLLSIRTEAQRIDRIVRTLLEYARGRERGRVEIDPATVVHRVRDLLEHQGKLEGIHTSWPPESTGMLVRLEVQQLEQVLVNLLLNALDAMSGAPGPGLELTIERDEGEVHRLPIRREDDPPQIDYRHRRRVSTDWNEGGPDLVFNAPDVVVIRIRDHGPGIEAAHLERVFDPFFTTKDPGKGTGLGLAICDRLVDGMGGRIAVENHPDGGALFTLRLPIHEPGADAS